MSEDAILKAIEAMQAELRMRGEETAHRFDRLDKRLDNLDRTDGLLANEVKALGSRVGGFELRLGRLEEDHTMAKRVSQDNDETQSAALTAAMHIHGKSLAALKAETDAKLSAQDKVLAQQTAMLLDQTKALSDISKALGHPMVRRIAWLIGAAILAWLSSKGLK